MTVLGVQVISGAGSGQVASRLREHDRPGLLAVTVADRPGLVAPAHRGGRAFQLIRLHRRTFFGSESQTSTSGNGFESGSNALSAL